jgi:hypothetical protein
VAGQFSTIVFADFSIDGIQISLDTQIFAIQHHLNFTSMGTNIVYTY